MGKFDGYLICTDLDGTLFNSERKVSEENAEAIEYFKREGGSFTFITGRPYYTARGAYEMVKPNVPFGCLNGGGIYDGEKHEYIMHRELDRSAFSIVDFITKNVPDVAVNVYTPDITYFPKVTEATRIYAKLTGCEIIERKIEEIDCPVSKIVFAHTVFSEIDRVSELVKEHPLYENFAFIRSERFLFEILPKENSKGNLLCELARYLGIDMKKTVAVGDYDNDISMVMAAGVGYAVENAVGELKAVADRITVSNDESAIARIIEDLGKGL